jgi:uncharacterized protein
MRLIIWTLIICLGAALGAVVKAQNYDPICQDPVSADTLFPTENRPVEITSSGFKMNGVLFMAQGPGPHPTVILLHGFPGNERNLDLAQVIRRSGWNVLTFQYRGAWGSEGSFSFANVLDDVAAAIAFIRGPAGDSGRCSPDQVVLIGHSMGGWAALMAAANDSLIQATVSIAAWNIGRDSRRLIDSAAFAAEVKDWKEGLLPLQGTSAAALTRERVDHLEEWDLANHLTPFIHRPILLIAASGDGPTAMADSYSILLSGLEAVKADKVTSAVLETDHAFSDRRIALTRLIVSWLKTLGPK